MKSSIHLLVIASLAVLSFSGLSSAQTWNVNGTSILPVPYYNVWVPGVDGWNEYGDQAVLYLGDGGNHYIKAVFGQGVKIGTYLAPDGITLAEQTGDVTITKGDLILSQGKINIKNSWTIEAPDYVFEKGYNLKPINEVEKFVKDNKHLPEIPSAVEMKKNGVELTEMNMKLLKKVEELTLYVIDQNKKIENLEEKVGVLTEKNR
jgi:hypothetical protein